LGESKEKIKKEGGERKLKQKPRYRVKWIILIKRQIKADKAKIGGSQIRKRTLNSSRGSGSEGLVVGKFSGSTKEEEVTVIQ